MRKLAAASVAHIQLHTTVMLFGFSGLFAKLIAFSPAVLVVGRTFFAAIAIFIFARLFSESLRLASWKMAVTLFLSGLVLAAHWLTFFQSIQISTVSIGVIGFATFPIFVTFIEPFVSRQKIRIIDVVSALIVMLGLFVVAPDFHLSNSVTMGLLWAVLSGLLYAILAIMNRHMVATSPSASIIFYQYLVVMLVVAPWALGSGEWPDTKSLWLLVLLGLVFTALPQTLFIKSLSVVKAQLASIVIGLEPIYGILFAALIIHEIPSFNTLLGAGLVCGAVLLATKAHAVSEDRP